MKKTGSIIAFMAIAFTAPAQWQQTQGPACSGDIKDILIDGQNVIVATGGGMYMSANNGASWQNINNGLINPAIWALAIKGSTIFAGTDMITLPSGVYASSNSGGSWNLRNIGISYPAIYSFAVDGSTIYAGTQGGGVSSSTNDAMSWTGANTGLPTNENIIALSANNGTVLASTYFNGVYRSTNGGSSWSPVTIGATNPPPPSGPRVQCFATLGSTVFAGASLSGYLYQSTDNGITWTQSNSGLTGWVYALEANGGTLYAGSTTGFFTSTNNGTTWSLNAGQLAGLNVTAIAASGSTVYAGTEQGVYVSLDGGGTWALSNYGLANIDTKCVFANGSTIFTGTYYGQGSFITTNGGTNWNPAGTGLTGDANVFAVNGNSLYAGTSMQGIYASTNNGANWTNISNNLTGPFQTQINDIAFCGGTVFIATQGGGVRSSSNGGNWSNTSLPANYVSALAVKGTTLFAGTANGLYKSTDYGATWTMCTIPNTGSSWVYTIKVRGNRIYLGCLDNNALLSTDDGNTWTNITNSGLPIRINSFAFDSTTVYAATWGLGVFTSTNSGTSWTTFNSGLTHFYVNSLVVSGGFLYAATASWGGVWKYPLPTPSDPNDPNDPVGLQHHSPESAGFSVYPNPFSASATLAFQQEVNNARITITDQLGNTLRSQSFSGKTLTLEKNALAPGIYFIRVVTGETVRQQKIIIH